MKEEPWLAVEMEEVRRQADEMEKVRWLADVIEKESVASRRDGGRTDD